MVFGDISILSLGNREQNKEHILKIASEELPVCLGLTPTGAVANTIKARTYARKDGDDWVMKRAKVSASMYEEAEAMVLVTRTTKMD